ncbi:hypothetical protein M885DRAFT_522250 [Pelagophyceae sp. CCMP2097]|nr:hypothetical protein M885DRAFT_522250 [Pelagophyceae sp. CCMP2097]
MDYSATGIAYDFALPTSGGGTLRARAQVDLPADGHDRMAWPQGPEGWLGRVGWVLPCRYDINTLGSTASVAVAVKSAAGAEEKLIEQSTTARAHVESNHGRAFPASWVWVQAADGVGRSLIAVGGRFKIGFLTVPTWIVAYRAPTLNPEDDWSFRTTDVALTRCTSTRLSPPTAVGAEEASLRLTLQKKRRFDMLRWKSRRRQLVLELDVRADTLDFFQDRLNVPTPKGFSTTPGCAEAFGAAATVRAYVVQGGTRRLVDEATLSQAALEFGGAHLVPE